jgi:histidyl-tRNA synthetase
LSGIAEIIGEPEKIAEITVAIDKLEKIGLEKVNAELSSKDIPLQAVEQLQPIIMLAGSNREKLAALKQMFTTTPTKPKIGHSETGLKGVEELEFIFDKIDTLGINNTLELDLSLARGLNYYTGAIFEVKTLDVQMGSITGGGRYDNLTGVFGWPDISGVGISFGADRIFDVLNQLALYPDESIYKTQLLFVNFGSKEEDYILPVIKQLREHGIRSEIYPESSRMNKQMNYANAKRIPYVVIAGENEINEGKITLKKMETGEQELLEWKELLQKMIHP